MAKWTEREMREAEIIHGPERNKSDTYRLRIEATDGKDGKDGKWLDVPGWFIGDPAMLAEKTEAAEIIRQRLTDDYNERMTNTTGTPLSTLDAG